MPTFASVGSASARVTLLAVPTPSLVTVIVNPTGLPATTLFASEVFVIVTCGLALRQMPAEAEPPPAAEVIVAVLSRFVTKFSTPFTQAAMEVPAGGVVVALVTWIVSVAPEARLPKEQTRVSLGGAPLIPQVPAPV